MQKVPDVLAFLNLFHLYLFSNQLWPIDFSQCVIPFSKQSFLCQHSENQTKINRSVIIINLMLEMPKHI